jgi:hypothetical protein
MTSIDRLKGVMARNSSLVCVGLHSNAARLPTGTGQMEFNKAIIDVTHDLVGA